jgi:hypothetical protein
LRSFWQRWRDPLGLYARLEARRSRARPEFVRHLATELGESRRSARTPLRLALVGALTLMMLAAAGTVGAAGYAGSALSNAANAIATVSSGGNDKIVLADDDDDDEGEDDDDDDGDDPDDDQYEEEREECERAVEATHDDFHDAQGGSHRLFHRQGGGSAAHRIFHRGQDDAHRAQHQLFRSALDECDQIGGGDRDDDDDDD